MLTPKEKSPLPETFSPEEDRTDDAASRSDSEPDTLPTSFIPAPQALWSANFCQLPCIETSTSKSVFLWYRSQRDGHLFCKFKMTFTCTNDVDKSYYHNRDFPVIVINELTGGGIYISVNCGIHLRCFIKFSFW